MKNLTSKEIQQIGLSILKKFADYCEEHGLHYSLAYGTLLGAARHEGFIPWDDDVDVLMGREDYDKMIEYYNKGERIDGLSLLYPNETSDYLTPFAKLCDDRTVAKEKSTKNKHGVWIDIFPVDKVPEDPNKALKFQKHMIFLRRVMIAHLTDFRNRKFDWKTIPKIALCVYSKIIGGRKLSKKIDREARKYNDSSSSKVCSVAGQPMVGGILTEAEFNDRIKFKFEQYEFYGPRCYDKYLRSLYGDYMVLPPENKRVAHGLIAYYKTEE